MNGLLGVILTKHQTLVGLFKEQYVKVLSAGKIVQPFKGLSPRLATGMPSTITLPRDPWRVLL